MRSLISNLLSILYSPSSILHPPSSILHPPSSILHPPSSILHPLSSILHPLSSILFFPLLLTTGCAQVMAYEGKVEPLQESEFFSDGRSARPHEPGTVARGQLQEDELLYTGKVEGELVDLFPFPVTGDLLGRGGERYDIFCSPCHSRTGDGRGMIVRRGFKQPPSFHLDRLREAPAGYYFDVISQGFGVMPSYAARVPVEDRWAIVAYIRALQLSQNATLADVPAGEREQLEGTK